MSHRGENPVDHTIQVWDGAKWIALNNAKFSDQGSDFDVSAPSPLTQRLSLSWQNVQVPSGAHLRLVDDVIIGVRAADAGPLSTGDSVIIGKDALTSLSAPNSVVGSVVIGERALRDNNSGLAGTTVVGFGVGVTRGAPYLNDTIVGFSATGNDATSTTGRTILGSGAAASGGGQECVVIGANAAANSSGASSSILIGTGIAPSLTGSGSLLLIGAGVSPGSPAFAGLLGAGNSIGLSVNNAFAAVPSLSGIHLGTNSFVSTTSVPSGLSISENSFGGNVSASGFVAMVGSSFLDTDSVFATQAFGSSIGSSSGSVSNSQLFGLSLYETEDDLTNVVSFGNVHSYGGAPTPLSDVQLFGSSLEIPAGFVSGYSSFQNVFVRQGTGKTAFGPVEANVPAQIGAQTASNAAYGGAPGAGVGDSKAVLGLVAQGASNTGAADVFVGDRDPNTASMVATKGDLYVNVSAGQLWQCTTSGTPGTWTQFSSGGAGSPSWVSLMSVALLTQQNIPWSGAPGGFGNLFCSALVPEVDTAPVTVAVALLSQVPAGAGGISIGIYDATGARLAYTNITAPAVGVNAFALAVGSGITLNAGSLYYIGVYSNRNGMRVVGATGIVGTPAGLTLGFSVPNSSTVVGALQGHPPNVSAFFGNQTAERYWAAFAG